MNGLNKHLCADGIRLHVQCWLTHANIQHFINKAIKFAVTFRDDVELLDQAFRYFTIVLEVAPTLSSSMRGHHQPFITVKAANSNT